MKNKLMVACAAISIALVIIGVAGLGKRAKNNSISTETQAVFELMTNGFSISTSSDEEVTAFWNTLLLTGKLGLSQNQIRPLVNLISQMIRAYSHADKGAFVEYRLPVIANSTPLINTQLAEHYRKRLEPGQLASGLLVDSMLAKAFGSNAVIEATEVLWTNHLITAKFKGHQENAYLLKAWKKLFTADAVVALTNASNPPDIRRLITGRANRGGHTPESLYDYGPYLKEIRDRQSGKALFCIVQFNVGENRFNGVHPVSLVAFWDANNSKWIPISFGIGSADVGILYFW